MKRGFTLIELLVVMAVISILASIVVVSAQSTRSQAQATQRIRDLQTLQTAVELYITDEGVYPTTTAAFWYDCYTDGTYYNNYIQGVVPDYLPTMPHDPTVEPGCIGGGDENFNYGYRSDGADYKIIVQVPNASMPNCEYGEDLGMVDPVRPCTSDDPTWALFTEGGRNW